MIQKKEKDKEKRAGLREKNARVCVRACFFVGKTKSESRLKRRLKRKNEKAGMASKEKYALVKEKVKWGSDWKMLPIRSQKKERL